MENEYARFAQQYSEMKTQINNDSLIAQLDMQRGQFFFQTHDFGRISGFHLLQFSQQLFRPLLLLMKLAEMDKREMENEYARFAQQYSEMKTQINNDSLIAMMIIFFLSIVEVFFAFLARAPKLIYNNGRKDNSLDKREMENEYARFAQQYSEMKTQINNDSLIAQLEQKAFFNF